MSQSYAVKSLHAYTRICVASATFAHVASRALQRFGNALGISLPCSLGHAPQFHTLLGMFNFGLPWYGAPGAVPPVPSCQYGTEQCAGSCLARKPPKIWT